MSHWVVKIEAKASDELLKAKKEKRISDEDMDVIRIWVEEIQEEGIESIKDSNFWNDHALDGKWSGYRSSSSSRLGRIIYRIEDKKIVVVVVRITTDHDYKRDK